MHVISRGANRDSLLNIPGGRLVDESDDREADFITK